MTTIGFVGLGVMGLPMAINLARRQFRVRGFDMRAAPLVALEGEGGTACASAAEAAQGADFLALMVVNATQARDALFAGGAFAHDYDLKSLHITHPFTRATPPGGQVAGAFMSIENRGKDTDRLVSVTSPVAGIAQIHEMAMDGGVMKMRAVKGIELKPGATVMLAPGGYHLMLEGLKQPLKEGDEIALLLTFERAGSIEVRAKVEAMGASRNPH